MPAWLTDADIDYYVSEFEQSGFRGPLNRYRNYDRDFAFLRDFEGSRIELPALYIGGERDMVLQMFGDRLPLMRAAFVEQVVLDPSFGIRYSARASMRPLWAPTSFVMDWPPRC